MVYRNLVVSSDGSGGFARQIAAADTDKLPKRDLVVNVKYAALNRLDALVALGGYNEAKYPICPGIDAVGEVAASNASAFNVGDAVIISGGVFGLTESGGFGEYVSVPAEWVTGVPVGLTLRTAATLGIHGVTAALGIANIAGACSETRRVAITGADSELGSIVCAMLSHLGYKLTAFIQNAQAAEFVEKMHIKDIRLMSEYKGRENTPFDAVFDTVGSVAVASLIANLAPGGICTVGGLCETGELNLDPLLLAKRGLSVLGVNGRILSAKQKRELWQFISSEALSPYFDWLCTEISIDEVESYLPLVLGYRVNGRVVINHGA